MSEQYLSNDIAEVIVSGESGNNARICDYDWILNIRRQCVVKEIPFYFLQTGVRFRKGGKLYLLSHKDQYSQAKKANINLKYTLDNKSEIEEDK